MVNEQGFSFPFLPYLFLVVIFYGFDEFVKWTWIFPFLFVRLCGGSDADVLSALDFIYFLLFFFFLFL